MTSALVATWAVFTYRCVRIFPASQMIVSWRTYHVDMRPQSIIWIHHCSNIPGLSVLLIAMSLTAPLLSCPFAVFYNSRIFRNSLEQLRALHGIQATQSTIPLSSKRFRISMSITSKLKHRQWDTWIITKRYSPFPTCNAHFMPNRNISCCLRNVVDNKMRYSK